MRLYIDIETIPTQSSDLRERFVTNATPPANYKNPDTIEKWRNENAESAYRATGLDASKGGELYAIGWAWDDSPVQVIRRDERGDDDPSDPSVTYSSERAMLQSFFLDVSDHTEHDGRPAPLTVVGHNIVNFDLPFIWRRAVILRVPVPTWWTPLIPSNLKPWSDRVEDTMVMWAGARGTVSLDNLCALFKVGGTYRGDITGATVWDAVQAGEGAEVAEYCRDDVERTRQCHARMMGR